jgi:uncharacterized protein YbbC (DUF1343 family)
VKLRSRDTCAGPLRTGKAFRLLLLLLAAQLAAPALAGDTLPRVLNGIDVLRQQKFGPLAGKRVGLVTNHTGVAADGTSTIDILFKSVVCKLVSLFSPEHGIRGTLDTNVGSSVDEKTGLPIHSLYGDTKRPTPGSLKGIEVLVYDIQDIGARFYTYATTLAYCLEEAAKARIPIYVLDRPNPLGGIAVEGPLLDADKTSFIGYMVLPVRHGMTLGELARYFNVENGIGADLHVVAMTGWRRNDYFDDTGQVWVNPSPNMRSLQAAFFYPGVCLLEATNVSVGRGTDRPFEVIGAPWIEPRRLAAELNASQLPGVKFIPLVFTPDAGTHRGSVCSGVNLVLTDRDRFDSVQTGMTLISVLFKLYREQFEIDRVLRLLGNERALKALKAGQSPTAVLRDGQPEMSRFLIRREKALIYGVDSRTGSK